MSAILYFLTSLGVHNFILALLSFLLGLILGWLIWGRRSSGPDFSAQYEAEKKKTSDLEAQLKNCKKARTDLEGKLKVAKDTPDLSSDLKAANTKISGLQAKVVALKASADGSDASEAELKAAKGKISDLEAELANLKANAKESGVSDTELEDANSKITDLEAKLSAANSDLDSCRAVKMKNMGCSILRN